MTDDPAMPVELADSALGARIRTVLHHLRTGARDLTEETLASTWHSTSPRYHLIRDDFAKWSGSLADFRVTGYEVRHQFAGAALIEDGTGRRYGCHVVIDPRSPHVILGSALFPSPRGVSAREAKDSDAAILRDIESRTPLVIGPAKVYYDRGPDYFAGERLMGDVDMFVVERDGRVLGVAGRAFPQVRIANKLYKGQYSHRLRLLPEAQGEGVRGPLNALSMERGVVEVYEGCITYAFIAEGNEAVLRTIEPERRWSIGAERLLIDTALAATEGILARSAEPSDAARIVELFNGMHETEELFVPFTVASLHARLERQPSAYSWHNILLNERAALGVWPARLGLRRESEGIVTDDVRALVLDYGCEPDGEDDLVSLMRIACRDLAKQGTTELSIFSSGPAHGYAALRAIAKRAEPYVVVCWKPPGPDIERRGVYVDQLYF
jgi:hypothetical protein